MPKKTKMTPEQVATKERLAAETKVRLEKVWRAPGFAAEHEAWRTEHRAAAEMCAARERAGMTQAELARRLRMPRANVSRIERGQNVTFATFARYLNGCGFDFAIRVFPIRKGTVSAASSRRREPAFA